MSQSQEYTAYMLHYDSGAYILVRVDQNFRIVRRTVLETRAQKELLVGTWVRVPTVSDLLEFCYQCSPADGFYRLTAPRTIVSGSW